MVAGTKNFPAAQDVAITRAVELLKALASPVRLRLLISLDRERDVGELAAALGVHRTVVSKHIRLLEWAGLVRARQHKKFRLYRRVEDAFRAASDQNGWSLATIDRKRNVALTLATANPHAKLGTRLE